MSTVMAYDADGNESPVKVYQIAYAMEDFKGDTVDDLLGHLETLGIYGVPAEWFGFGRDNTGERYIYATVAFIEAYMHRLQDTN